MKRVVILHGYTTHYRIPFFKELDRILRDNGIILKVVIGQPSKFENFGEVENLSFFKWVNNSYFYFKNRYLVWEPVFKHIRNQDLVVIRQANKHLANPFVYIYTKIVGAKVGMWGNMKGYLNNNKKRSHFFVTKADCWFAYNDLTKKILVSAGYPTSKVVSVNNSIDTKAEREMYDLVSNDEIIEIYQNCNIYAEDIVGLFCSRLYPDKRIEFLLEAIKGVKEKVPSFKFIVVGEGEDSEKIMEFAENNKSWFSWVGAKYGIEKIKYFRISSFQLLPGAVGLHIVDSFAMETPIITTYSDTHGVEIDYLNNFDNGIICNNSIKDYTDTIIHVCKDEVLREKLKKGCRESAQLYTIENMAKNFAFGIIKCLSLKELKG